MFIKWINDPKEFAEENGLIQITAGEKTNLFIDPTSDYRIDNAPNYVREAKGDFTITCEVKPYFNDIYDAGAIILYIGEDNWVKFAFENTDLGHKAVVSVVTKGYSDDSNGEKVVDESIWMKMSRRKDAIGLYYSIDSVNWKMVRLLKHDIKKDDKVYIGVQAQSPRGKECKVDFRQVTFVEESVKDMRKGS